MEVVDAFLFLRDGRVVVGRVVVEDEERQARGEDICFRFRRRERRDASAVEAVGRVNVVEDMIMMKSVMIER